LLARKRENDSLEIKEQQTDLEKKLEESSN
jgi:hypothetical protein